MANQINYNHRHPLTESEIRAKTSESIARSKEKRERWNPNAVKLAMFAGAALVGTTIALATGMRGNNNTAPSAAPDGRQGAVPEATMDYLKSLPTQEATVPVGGGIDNAAYQVDPHTFTESADIHAGVQEILNSQVPHTEAGVPVPQAGQELDVPVVPPIESIPPEAR